MKKALSLLLLACMLIGLIGCSEKPAQQQSATTDTELSGLCVGYSIVDITPKEATPLRGFGATQHRISNDVQYSLKATCVALTGEDGNTVLLIETDLVSAEDFIYDARVLINKATGVPEDQIMIAGSHTHAGPDLSQYTFPSVENYRLYLMEQLQKVSAEALADRKSAEVWYGSAETTGLNFVRNYKQVGENGNEEYFGDNYGQLVTPNDTAQGMTEADPTLHVVKFTRQGEKDIVLCNFRAHPSFHGSSSKYSVSADFIGAFREAMILQHDCDFMYVQGACGNINSYSRNPSVADITDCEQYGTLLTQTATEAMQNMTKGSGMSVKHKQMIIEGEVNHEMDSLVIQARNISTVWNLNRNISECIEMGAPYGIRSPFHANAITARSKEGPTQPYELNVITVGDSIAFAVCPFEMFDTLSVMLEEQAPYSHVFMVGYANEKICYMPSAYGFEYTCYESDICRFVAGTGEIIVEHLLDAMQELKNS